MDTIMIKFLFYAAPVCYLESIHCPWTTYYNVREQVDYTFVHKLLRLSETKISR